MKYLQVGKKMRSDLYTRPRFWIGHGDPQCHTTWGKIQKHKSMHLLKSQRGK